MRVRPGPTAHQPGAYGNYWLRLRSTTIGTNGTMTVDEDRLFNGSPERYILKLIGKREIYSPANAFKANTGTVN